MGTNRTRGQRGQVRGSGPSCLWTLHFFRKYSDATFIRCCVTLFIQCTAVSSYFIHVPDFFPHGHSSITWVDSDECQFARTFVCCNQNPSERSGTVQIGNLSFLEPVLTEQWNLLSRRHLAAHEAASPWPDPVRKAKPARRDGSASPGAAALPSLASAQPGSAREWQAGKKRRARPVRPPPPASSPFCLL